MTEFDLRLTPEGIRTLSYAVNEALRLWPGSPARPPEEQETLRALKISLFAMSMEIAMEAPDEGGA